MEIKYRIVVFGICRFWELDKILSKRITKKIHEYTDIFRHCAFIMHTSAENFMCYVFHVEPTAALLAKTIEAACKLRYQKVLDAHLGNKNGSMRRAESFNHGKIVALHPKSSNLQRKILEIG